MTATTTTRLRLTPAEFAAVREVASLLDVLLDTYREEVALARVANRLPRDYRVVSGLIQRGAFAGISVTAFARQNAERKAAA
jgi:hypothetical protein